MGRIAAGALLLLLLLGSWAPGAAALGQPHAQRNLLLGLPPQVSSTLAGAGKEARHITDGTTTHRGGASGCVPAVPGCPLEHQIQLPTPAPPAQCTSGSGLGTELSLS